MRRTSTALLALTLGLALLVPHVVPAHADTVEVSIEPQIQGNTAVRDGQFVDVSGSAPAGEQVDAARLIGFGASQGGARPQTTQEVSQSHLNSEPRSGTWLRNDDGALEGQVLLGCRFGEPDAPCPHEHPPVRSVLLEVEIAGETVRSDEVRVDWVRPFIRRYDVVDTDRIVVVFSEPVRHPQFDSRLDWEITDPDRDVLEVRGPREDDCVGEYQPGEDETAGDTGCTRTLVVFPSLGEDDTPTVQPRATVVPDRQPYEDFASNTSFMKTEQALNRVRPPRPAIEEVAGEAPEGDGPRVASAERDPVLRVSNLREGHDVFFAIERPSGARFDTSDDPFVVPGDGAHDIELPEPLVDPGAGEGVGDGDYRIEAIVVDPHGNRSDDAGKSPARDDASPSVVTYHLDTAPPRLVSSELVASREVRVQLSEPVVPEGHAGDWRIDGRAVNAEGSGAERVLRTTFDLGEEGHRLTWNPVDGSAYTDAVGNRMLPVDTVVGAIVPTVVITNPVSGALVGRLLPVYWEVSAGTPTVVDLDYRVSGGSWRPIAHGLPGDGHFDWQVPATVAEGALLDLRLTATDADGAQAAAIETDLRLVTDEPPFVTGLPDVVASLLTTGERELTITFTEPVDLAPVPSGFSVVAGPGVDAVEGSGTAWRLELNAGLDTPTPIVAFNGRGAETSSGTEVPPFRAFVDRDVVLAVRDLVGVTTSTGDVELSWVEERNDPADVAGYEIRRDGDVVAALGAQARTWTDTAVDGAAAYTVTTLDTDGRTSRPAETTVDPGAAAITPDGGFVMSDDGEVALLVPPGAVDADHEARLERVPAGSTGRFRPVTDAYRLSVEAADGTPLDRFATYACLSLRPGRAALAGLETARLSALRLDGTPVELATRVGDESARTCLLTPGTFVLGEAEGATTRVFGPDPAIRHDRFATAAGLSQVGFHEAGVAVITRSDDFPDALAAASLAEQLGAPILLVRPGEVREATTMELERLGVSRVVIIGGTEAVSSGVEFDLRALGYAVERVSGPTRYGTAAAIADRVGAFGGRVYLATGTVFADALSGSTPNARLGRPMLLTRPDELPTVTAAAFENLGIERVDVLGGPAAATTDIDRGLIGAGYAVRRIFGADRYETSSRLADVLIRAAQVDDDRFVAATGRGDGRTSPDALAAGPVGARHANALLLVPPDRLAASIDGLLRERLGVRGITLAGGNEAVADSVRDALDDAAR